MDLLINMIMDVINMILIVWLIIHLYHNYKTYQNGLKALRLSILVATCCFSISTFTMLANSVCNYFQIFEFDYIISFLPIRTFYRVVVFFCLMIYIKMIKGTHTSKWEKIKDLWT